MEKISKVVAATVKGNIDMSKERPMRSGAPNYGAPVAHSAPVLQKMEQEKQLAAAKAEAAMKEQELNKHAEIVDKVTLNFRKVEPNLLQSEISNSTENEPESISPMNAVEEIQNAQPEKVGLSLYA